jgi:hypothetical protein
MRRFVCNPICASKLENTLCFAVADINERFAHHVLFHDAPGPDTAVVENRLATAWQIALIKPLNGRSPKLIPLAGKRGAWAQKILSVILLPLPLLSFQETRKFR